MGGSAAVWREAIPAFHPASPTSAGRRLPILVLNGRGAVVGRTASAAHLVADGGLGRDDLEAVLSARSRLGEDATFSIVRLGGADGAPLFAYLMRARDLPEALAVDLEAAPAPEMLALVLPAVELAEDLTPMLREGFGLTLAEARLAILLAEGPTLAEAADRLGVSVNTVRNQLRAVFDKLGLNRQSELVRAITQLAQTARVFVSARRPPPGPARLRLA